MMPQRHWLPWNLPVAAQAAGWLLQQAPPHARPPDLSRLLVLVPTAEAGRLLRASLARLAPGCSLISPRVLTAGQLASLSPGSSPPEAPRLHRLAAWLEVLTGPTPAKCPALFPSLPRLPDRSWALPVAELLLETEDTLAEGGWSLESAAPAATADATRWNDLARLGLAHSRLLASWKMAGPAARWNAWLDDPQPPAGIERIVLAALPDPFPVTLKLLDLWKEKIPIDILIHAPSGESSHFDDWGRPIVSHWTERPINLPSLDQHLHLTPDSRTTAARAAQIALRHADPAAVVFGCCREESLPSLQDELSHLGLQGFNPTGRPAHHGTAGSLLATLRDLAATRSYASLQALARHPGGGAWLCRLCGLDDNDKLLSLLDDFADACLPESIDHLALTRSPLPDLPRRLDQRLRSLDNPDSLAGWLEELLDPPLPGTEAEALGESWTISRDVWSLLPRPDSTTAIELLLHELASRRLPDTRHENDQELLGWLELPWSEAPHLVLVEPQEGAIPAALRGHPFLPEALRESLGLRTNALRHARDAFLLQGLCQSRRASGRVDLLLSRSAGDGSPLHPSRLLLQVPAHSLPERVQTLFAPLPPPDETPFLSTAWSLRLPPPPAGAAKKISVTAFSRYLRDPLLFYLTDVLRWEEHGSAKTALDARDFGHLAHKVLELWAGNAETVSLADPGKLSAHWETTLLDLAHTACGNPLPLSVELQVSILASRLRALATAQIQHAREGWQITHLEEKFHWPLHGWTITGKIDRIEKHPDGRVLLLDYKTSENRTEPGKAHLRTLTARTRDRGAPEAAFAWEGKDAAWINLQLPLYAAAWSELHNVPLELIQCAYVQLPRTPDEIRFDPWPQFNPALAVEARDCAVRVLTALDENRFWPPGTAEWRRDPWPVWFPDGAAALLPPPVPAP